MIKKIIKSFFESKSVGSILILAGTALAMIVSNSSWLQTYNNFLQTYLPLTIDFLHVEQNLSLHGWINDALMAVFFLLVGLELKKEILVGELSTKVKFSLPIIAALGGVVFPSLIFLIININNPENWSGFAISSATDIVFAYGIISLFGKKIPNSIKVFIIALAVLDDLAAIIFIALFYTKNLQVYYLLTALIPVAGLVFLNRIKFAEIIPYIILGILLWLMIAKSGVNPTLAGVILAIFIPFKVKNKLVLEGFAYKIAPMVNLFILPIFAFANSGIRLKNYENLLSPLVLGISLGLFLGKQLGVVLFSFLAVKFKIAKFPQGANFLQFYGAAIFTGIGFTMSLFIGGLAFSRNELILDEIKIGVMVGSIFSILYGSLIIFYSNREKK